MTTLQFTRQLILMSLTQRQTTKMPLVIALDTAIYVWRFVSYASSTKANPSTNNTELVEGIEQQETRHNEQVT